MQKTPRKNTKYSRNKRSLKIAHLAKAVANAKAYPLQNGQFGSKIKNAKNMRKIDSTRTIRVVLCKKPLEKTPNIPEMRGTLKIGHLAKAIAHP